MPIAYFKDSYEWLSPPEVAKPGRRVAFAQAAAKDVEAASGFWAESEQPDDKALIRVRAPTAVLARLAKDFERIDDPHTHWRPTPNRWTKPVDNLESDVYDDDKHDQHRRLVADLIKEAEEKGYARLKGLPWPEAAAALCMCGNKGFSLDRISTGTFPVTSILSSFTGADEDPLSEGAMWTTVTGYRAHRRATNQAARSASGSGGCKMHWNPQTYGPNSESYVTLGAIAASGYVILNLRAAVVNSEANTYFALITNGTDEIQLGRIVAGTTTFFGGFVAQAPASGHKLGLEMIGTAIVVYYNTAGTWSAKISTTDGSITAAGYIGLEGSNDTTFRADDFAGGSIVTGQPQAKRFGGVPFMRRGRHSVW